MKFYEKVLISPLDGVGLPVFEQQLVAYLPLPPIFLLFYTPNQFLK